MVVTEPRLKNQIKLSFRERGSDVLKRVVVYILSYYILSLYHFSSSCNEIERVKNTIVESFARICIFSSLIVKCRTDSAPDVGLVISIVLNWIGDVREWTLESGIRAPVLGSMAKQRVEIEKFDGALDFSLWKIRMMAHLGLLGLKGIIHDFDLTMEVPLTKSEEKKPKTDGDDDSDKPDKSSLTYTKIVPDPVKVDKSEHAMHLIILNVGDTVLRKINHCVTAAEMWNTLNKEYMETSLPNRVYLQLKFYSFKMNESKYINDNVDDFFKIVAEFGSLDSRIR